MTPPTREEVEEAMAWAREPHNHDYRIDCKDRACILAAEVTRLRGELADAINKYRNEITRGRKACEEIVELAVKDTEARAQVLERREADHIEEMRAVKDELAATSIHIMTCAARHDCGYCMDFVGAVLDGTAPNSVEGEK